MAGNTKPKICSIDNCSKPVYCHNLCQMHNWRLKYYGNVHHVREQTICSIPGCGRLHKAHGLCALHANRMKKGIPLDYEKPKLAKKYYRMTHDPNHPLAFIDGRVAVHRKNLYDSVCGSRLPCFWCGMPLEWGEDLFVDHKNHDRHDNRPENLVPSCNNCNAGRTITNSHIRQSIYRAA